MSQRRLFSYISLALLILVGLVALVRYQSSSLDQYRPRIVQLLEQITGHTVSIRRIQYAPMNGLFTLQIDELEILAMDPTEPPILKAAETLLSFEPVSLLSARPQLSAIKLIVPQFSLVLRDHTPLIERAQDTVIASNEKLFDTLGLAFTELTIGRISIQNGMLVILDWNHDEGHTWVFDHLQVGVHSLNPLSASPLTATARFRSIPFTVNGHIGPLPSSLDPLEMPMLLSVEAKSIGLNEIQEWLSSEEVKVKTSRGHLTTLLHGSLMAGLQTSSWLQLDGVSLQYRDASPDMQAQAEKKTEDNRSLMDRFKERNEKTTMDVALRQKSTLKMSADKKNTLSFEEFFLYLDGSPILKTTGKVDGWWRGPMALHTEILNVVDLDQFPWPNPFPMGGKSPTGFFKVSGVWPDFLDYSVNLDLSQTSIHLPPLEKDKTTALTLQLHAAQENGQITIKELALKNPDNPDYFVKMDGFVAPKLLLKTSANWPMQEIKAYLPIAEQWNGSGIAQLVMTLTQTDPDNAWQADGSLRMKQGTMNQWAFQDLRIPFHLEKNWLEAPHMEMSLAQGRVEAMLLADLSHDPILFDTRLSLAGPDLALLPGQPEAQEGPRLEGFLFADATLHGQLDRETLTQIDEMAGSGYLRIEPGRLTGVDHNAFSQPPSGEGNISRKDKSLYWNTLEMNANLLGGTVTMEKILLKMDERTITGKGFWQWEGDQRFTLQIHPSPAMGVPTDQDFTILIEGDSVTNGFRMRPAQQGDFQGK